MIFTTQPAGFKKEIDVVGCYLEHGGEFVLLHRHVHKTNGEKWGLPAGKVDPGESVQIAMRREVAEETGVDVPLAALKHFGSVFVRNDGHDIHYHMFSALFPVRPTIIINPKEHQAHAWVTPRHALEMDLIHDLDECIRMFYPV